MRIMEGRDAGYFVDRYFGTYGQEHDKAMSDWKKNRSLYISLENKRRQFIQSILSKNVFYIYRNRL